MALKLRVISDHYKALGKRSSRLFGVTGGRIGRAQDNDWILPDPDRYVSSHHCKVDFRAGQWVLEDTSTNGVFINGSDTPASVDGAYTLQDGDRLRLGDYEVLVSIDERNDFPADASGQMPAPPRVRNKSHVRTAPRATDDDLGEELDLTDLISDSAIAPAPISPPPRRPSPSSAPLDLESALALDSDDLKAMAPDSRRAGAGRRRRARHSLRCWATAASTRQSLMVARPKLRRSSRSRARRTTGTCRRGRTIASRCRRSPRPPRWRSPTSREPGASASAPRDEQLRRTVERSRSFLPRRGHRSGAACPPTRRTRC